MRPTKSNFIGLMGLVLGAALIIACGGTDGFLDESNDRFTYSVTLDDGGSSELQVDILQSNCDGNTTSSEDDEDFFATLATITISVDELAPALTLKNYTIEYIPVQSPDGDNLIADPPPLLNPGTSYLSWQIDSGQIASESIPLISIDTKEDYRDLVGIVQDPITLAVTVFPALTNSYYRIRITLDFEDENNQEETIVIERTVLFGPWDNC